MSLHTTSAVGRKLGLDLDPYSYGRDHDAESDALGSVGGSAPTGTPPGPSRDGPSLERRSRRSAAARRLNEVRQLELPVPGAYERARHLWMRVCEESSGRDLICRWCGIEARGRSWRVRVYRLHDGTTTTERPICLSQYPVRVPT